MCNFLLVSLGIHDRYMLDAHRKIPRALKLGKLQQCIKPHILAPFGLEVGTLNQ